MADTLYNQSKPLATENETRFKVPLSKLPAASLRLRAKIIFRNSNNELHEEMTDVTYQSIARELFVVNEGDSMIADFKINGKSVPAVGTVHVKGDIFDQTTVIQFPAKIKIDPLAEKLTFEIIQGSDTIRQTEIIANNYYLTLNRISRRDTVGFVLNNPNKMPVNFIVLHNNALVATGKSNEAQIRWQMKVRNKRQLYMVKWQYMWGSVLREGSESLALLYKLLKIETQHNNIVFPGQKDSITVQVTDYKQRAAKGVNLAAVGYNSQFKSEINVPEPPYLVNYKNRPSIVRGTYETDESYLIKRYLLGNYPQWITRFGVDSLQFYKMLFPKSTPLDVVSPVSEFVPQISVHVVAKGRPQQIYLLYINRQLVYYNGVTDKMKNAWYATQGYTQVAFRLYNKYIELDSIYMQPFYKHDIVIDLDKLPLNAVIREMPPNWTPQEKSLIENSIWQLDNDRTTNDGYVWQNERLVKLEGNKTHLVGPFREKSVLQFFAPGDFDISFTFEPRYEYRLSKQITRLERQNIFSYGKKPTPLPKIMRSTWVLGDTLVPPPEISYPVVKTQPSIRINNPPLNKLSGSGKLLFTVSRDTFVSLKYVALIGEAGISNAYVLIG